MLNGLDFFSGIGGIALALKEWVNPIAYCEIDRYCQSVLLSRMSDGAIYEAPIWDDIRTFESGLFRPGSIDIITGGFPCQDISIAGRGKGLAGERSGLYWEIHRLAKEIKPRFVFLENVPAILSRGGSAVAESLAEIGYDLRWCVLSAQGCGAPHKRERWWLLAHSQHDGSYESSLCRGPAENVSNSQERAESSLQSQGMDCSRDVASTGNSDCEFKHKISKRKISSSMEKNSNYSRITQRSIPGKLGQELRKIAANSDSSGRREEHRGAFEGKGKKENLESQRVGPRVAADSQGKRKGIAGRIEQEISSSGISGLSSYWQEIEPPFCGVDDGVSYRVDRIRSLGNSVVPQCAKKAFEYLMGLKV